MNRPAQIACILTAINAHRGFSYVATRRLKAAFTGWANRTGPVTNGPSAPFLRDLVPIEPGTQRAAQAAEIDELMTEIAKEANDPQIIEVKLEILLTRLYRQLQAAEWHP